jgi:hypothetical protein
MPTNERSMTEFNLAELEIALQHFIIKFEGVFEFDWEYTRDHILDEYYISPEGTFINPKCKDESNNWANRGGFLASYRRLKSAMAQAGLNCESDLPTLQMAPPNPLKN